jgi:HD-like signal output (HDOD) protein
MATKSILLAVAEPQALVDITQALGDDWEATSVACEADAITQLESRSFHALLVDFNLGSPDASELLNQAFEKRPETIRFLLAYEADLALVAAKVLASPQILPKPIEPVSLKNRIEDAVTDPTPTQTASEASAGDSDSPKVPLVYSEVLKALELPGVTSEQVGDIVARDEDLISEVLELTNSTYLGLPRNVTDPVEAVDSLGLETVKALVMALQFLAEHSRLKPGYLSLDQIWQHSVKVGQIARDLVLFETKDRKLAAQALTAGLLHDLGKVVLATNFDDLYGRVHSLASKQPVTLWDIEKEMFGANHGEIGACLVGMWNMPAPIVDAAALHHEPPLDGDQKLTPLAAVHIANVLERELGPGDEDMMVGPIINTPFLNELGLLQRLPVWRAAFANSQAGIFESEEVESTETDQSEASVLSSATPSRTANYLPGPAATTQTSQPLLEGRTPSVDATRQWRGWIYAGVAAGILMLLALWFTAQPEGSQLEPAYARTPARPEAPTVTSSIPSQEASRVAASPTAPAPAVPEQPTATPASAPPVPTQSAPAATDSKPVASLPAPEPAGTPASAPAASNAPLPSAATQEKPLPEFRVSAIIYTARPAAIVNGETVNVGDQVDGATVVGIGRTTVSLQINGQRKTYQLR